MKAGEPRPLQELDFRNAFVGPLITALSFIAFSIWSWHKGGDFFTDFGHELYLAWRLSAGEILYRDLPWILGPLSQQTNGLIFKTFGVAVGNLLAANLFVIAILAAALFVLVRRSTDRLTATLAVTSILGIFCFGHLLDEGVFNFLTPYAHEATHGALACVLLILSLDTWLRTKRAIFGFSAGMSAGLAFMTKIEMVTAATFIVIVFFLSLRLLNLRLAKRYLFVVGLCIPLCCFLVYFLQHRTLLEALRSTFGAFSFLSQSEASVIFDYYQLRGMGFDDWRGNFATTVAATVLCIALTLAAMVLDKIVTGRKHATAISIGFAGVIFIALYLKPSIFPWIEAPRYLLPLCPALTLYILWKLRTCRPSAETISTSAAALLWLVFSMVFLSRLGLRTRFYHYGFFLALPAMLSAIVAYVYFIPLALRKHHSGGMTFRCCTVAFFLAALMIHVRFSDHYYAQRTLAVGDDADRLYLNSPEASQQSQVAAAAFMRIKELVHPSDSLAVVPSGALINYYLRVPNSTGIPILAPNVINMLGEERMFSKFERAPPTFIVITEMDAREVGLGTLGQDPQFMPRLWNWIGKTYQPPVALVAGEQRPYPQILERIQNAADAVPNRQ